MKYIVELLYYGGISRKNWNKICADIDESNRKSVIAYSLISMAGFIFMAIYAVLSDNAVTKNRFLYIFGVIIMVIFLILSINSSKKNIGIIHTIEYLFVIVLFLIGILLAVSSKDDVTASYMVFLFVAPLLFTLRPIYIDIVIIVTDLIYIILMGKIQTPLLYHKNLVNAIIYGILSVIVCTTMTRMRIRKFETDYMNRILMETDQLTGMLNRLSFDQHIDRIRKLGNVDKIKVCAFDVNGLKSVNDNIGHHAGDELLRGATACLENVFSNYGYCYRVGGDEFIAILSGDSPTEEELIEMLNSQTLSFKGIYVPNLSISVGIETGSETDTIETLLRKADLKMYRNKALYYKKIKEKSI